MGAAGDCCPHLGAEPQFRLALRMASDGGGPPPKFPAVRTSYPQRALLITTNNSAPHRIWHAPGRSLGNRPRRAGDASRRPRRPLRASRIHVRMMQICTRFALQSRPKSARRASTIVVRPSDCRPALRHAASRLHHHVVVLDADRHGFGHIGPGHQPRARLHRDRIGTRAHAGGVAPGLAGADVELPAVPGAADDLARAGVAVVARARPIPRARSACPGTGCRRDADSGC